MRKKLSKIGSEKRHTFVATFVRIGWKDGFRGPIETILLQDVKKLNEDEIVTNHLWFNYTVGFRNANLHAGDKVRFDARVQTYAKGYKGFRDDVYKPIETDYHLTYPTKIVNLSAQPDQSKTVFKPRFRKREYQRQPASNAQLDLIKRICKWKGLPNPGLLTKKEASRWFAQQNIDWMAYRRDCVSSLKREQGRKTHEAVIKCVQQGMSIDQTCEAVSIKRSTYYVHVRKAKEEGRISK